nr:uncharacterized protein LOC100175554 isoform X1 [Ciona intestinalis]|eukprot:XP_026689954.1 uncharacterized protein LOC100175554 isoform X1 [Ciona intestinalis]
MSDECGGNGTCTETFTCDDGSCIALSRFCDGTQDCANGEDEIESDSTLGNMAVSCSNRYQSINNKLYNTHTNRVCSLPLRHVCDGVDHCENRTDECQEGCVHSLFCDGGDTCHHRSSLCNGESECSDGKDEPLKNGEHISIKRGFKCTVERHGSQNLCVVPQEFLEDDVKDCVDESDWCLVSVNGSTTNNNCAQCITEPGFFISKKQICDGNFDCPDLSDECLCQNQNTSNICANLCFGPSTVRGHCPCPPYSVPCLLSNDTNKEYEEQEINCIDSLKFCDGVLDCPNGADELYCGPGSERSERYYSHQCTRSQPKNIWAPIEATACDGKPECIDMEDECLDSCGEKPYFCSKMGPTGLFTCSEQYTLPGRLICDGHKNCSKSGEDEIGCTNRFICKNETAKVYSVRKSQVCDFVADCEDQSDEADCHASHFYCEGGKPFFVDKRYMFDGKRDCEDGSDECPKDSFKGSVFSSAENMIESRFLQVMVWVMGILAIGGNAAVIVHTISLLCYHARRKLTKVAVVYSCLVLNLSIADLLMGVFLIALGIRSASTSGNYCLIDHSWRSGTPCSVLGTLAVLSSEVSLLTLAILSSYRMFCVIWPIQSRTLQVHFSIGLAVSTWIFAGTIAFIPLSKMFQEYFVTQTMLSTNPYFFTELVDKPAFTTFSKILLSYKNDTSPAVQQGNLFTWERMSKQLKDFNPEYKAISYLGYYSTHATCLPKLFVDKRDLGWQFSLTVTITNFILCLYIVGAYAVIFRPRQVNKSSVTSQGTRNMQKRIAILVATDCACWLPICLIAFLIFSGVEISNTVYSITAIIILPINSALNPLFYSNAVQILFTRILNYLSKFETFNAVRKSIAGITIFKCWKTATEKREGQDGKNLLRGHEDTDGGHIVKMKSHVTEHTVLDTVMTESVV